MTRFLTMIEGRVGIVILWLFTALAVALALISVAMAYGPGSKRGHPTIPITTNERN